MPARGSRGGKSSRRGRVVRVTQVRAAQHAAQHAALLSSTAGSTSESTTSASTTAVSTSTTSASTTTSLSTTSVSTSTTSVVTTTSSDIVPTDSIAISRETSPAREDDGEHSDSDPPPPSKKAKIGKRKPAGKGKGKAEKVDGSERHTVTFTPQQEEDCIEFFRNHPIIYDKKINDYKNKHKKDAAWRAGAIAIGVDEADLRQWYRTQRTMLGKLYDKKMKSGSGYEDLTERERWIVEKWQFIRKHMYQVKPRPTRSLMSKLAELPTPTHGPEDSDPDAAPLSPVSSDVEGPESPPTRTATATVSQSTRPSATLTTRTSTTLSTTRPLTTPSSADLQCLDVRPTRGSAKAAAAKEDKLLGQISTNQDRSLNIAESMLKLLQPPTTERTAYADWTRHVMLDLHPSLWRRFEHEHSQLLFRYTGLNDELVPPPTQPPHPPPEERRPEFRQQQSETSSTDQQSNRPPLQNQPSQDPSLDMPNIPLTRPFHSRTSSQPSTSTYVPPSSLAQERPTYWQPPPHRWPTTVTAPRLGLWGSQDPRWMAKNLPGSVPSSQVLVPGTLPGTTVTQLQPMTRSTTPAPTTPATPQTDHSLNCPSYDTSNISGNFSYSDMLIDMTTTKKQDPPPSADSIDEDQE